LVGWLILTVVGAISALAGLADSQVLEWAIGLLLVIVVPLAVLLGSLKFWLKDKSESKPHPANILCCLATGLIILSIFWYRSSVNFGVMQDSAASYLSKPHLFGFDPQQLQSWCWPTSGVTVPIMAWGLLRTVWRGWREWKKSLPPTAWLLCIYTAIIFLAVSINSANGEATALEFLASWGAILLVFGLAEVFRVISERLVLLPPAERQEA
jgi:hypothetical protein